MKSLLLSNTTLRSGSSERFDPTKRYHCQRSFQNKPIDGAKLYSLFGHITPLSTASEEKVLSLNQPVKELLDEAELIATIHTSFEKLCSVACQNEEQIWTSGLIQHDRFTPADNPDKI